MSVGMPPMDVEKAMPRKMDLAKPFTFFSPNRLFSDSTSALQFATIISAAAVLLTKIDSTAPVHMMPSSIERGRVKSRMMHSAMRMWRFHFSIASDIKKPAKNRKITEPRCPHTDPTVVEVLRGDRRGGENVQERKEDHGEQSGHGQRDDLADP